MNSTSGVPVIALMLMMLSCNAMAQLTVSTGQTAQQLAEIIAGPGVVVSNASITGDATAIGAFGEGSTPTGINLSSGVLMSSGNVTDVAAGSVNFASTIVGSAGDPYLTAQSGETSNDAIVLQFDFVPNADYVQFKYVFGSEEYPEWVCSTYNDMFAFTIQGVTVALPQTNIALIPGTSIPVAINTINNDASCGGDYSAFFIDNEIASQPSYGQIVYDGLTTVLIAEANVICGETYTLRLMLSDGGDASYDSGCFIEENSLTTGSVTIETSTAAADSTAYEGCNDATVTLTLNGPPIAQDFPVPIWISDATADWTIDYDAISELNQSDSSIIIPAGQNTVSFTISPVNDNLAEGTEYIEFTVITSSCGLMETFRVYISDLAPIVTAASNDTTICIGNAILTCTASGGGGIFNYTWDNGLGTGETVLPSPTSTTIYHVSVQDNCGSLPVIDSVTVTVDGGPIPFAGNDVSVCIGGSILMNASSDTPGSIFTWNPPTDLSDPDIPNPLCTPLSDMEYIVTVTRWDDCSNDDTVNVFLTPPPTADFTLPANGCAGQPLIVEYSGNASASAQYQWLFDGGTVANGNGIGPYAVFWSAPGLYDVSLTVSWNGCISSPSTDQIEVIGPPSVDAGPDVYFCSGDSAVIGSVPFGGLGYSWSPINGLTDALSSSTEVLLTNATHHVQTTQYFLTASDQGCENQDSVSVTVFPIPTASFDIPAGKCFNVNSFDLLATGYFGPNASFYWDFGPVGFPANSTSIQPEGVIFNVPGPQQVSLVVEDNSCLSDTFTGVIDVFALPIADFTSDKVEGCEPLTISFIDQSFDGNSMLYYLWDLGDGASATQQDPDHVYAEGVYDVKLYVVTAEGCRDSIIKAGYISAYRKPVALFSLSNYELDMLAPEVTASDLADGIISSEFIFHPFEDRITAMNATYEYPDTGTYSITQIVSTQHGCTDTISAELTVRPHYSFYIPNAFTPDNNDRNEVWTPKGENIMTYGLTVYDRWDEELFISSNIEYGWDGTYKNKPVPEGVYTFKIDVMDVLGEPHKYVGTFTLVR